MKVIYLMLLINIAVISSVTSHRMKRDWVYPTFYIKENINGETFTRKPLQFVIKRKEPEVESFELLGKPVDDGVFSMETINKEGIIYQEKPLDREKQEFYYMQAWALDSKGQRVPPVSEIEIKVKDLNDNSPVFDVNSLQVNVQEDTAVGDFFHQINATDADLNEVIKFTKYPNSENPKGDRFEVMPNGDLIVKASLEADTSDEASKPSSVTFKVKAQDADGKGPGITNATVTVFITDANDHAPRFLKPFYECDVDETELLNQPLQMCSVEAEDDDSAGINKATYFKIDGGNTMGNFEISSFPSYSGISSAKLVLKKHLDFESPPQKYVLTIVAYNKEASNSDIALYQDRVKFTVNVKDKNEAPIFLEQPYKGTISENVNYIQQLKRPVSARDYDFNGDNVTYEVLPPGNQWFQINHDGFISVKEDFDRENPEVLSNLDNSGVYNLRIKASDSFGLNSVASYFITINDDNDNPPMPHGDGWDVAICDQIKTNDTLYHVTDIKAIDQDSLENGPPFTFSFVRNSKFLIDGISPDSARIDTRNKYFDINEKNIYEEEVLIKDTGKNKTSNSYTATLTIRICSCGDDNFPDCAAVIPVVGTASSSILIAVIVAILLLLLIIFVAIFAIRRKQAGYEAKENLLIDEDDYRNTLGVYHDEGGGEEDNEIFDIGVLQPLEPGVPLRIDEKPLYGAQQPHVRFAPDDITEEDIDEAKKQIDADPSAPPFDSLLVFDYEGQGSDAGSLSSINSGTTDGSQNYDYLKDWGPRFSKIADAYGGEDSD